MFKFLRRKKSAAAVLGPVAPVAAPPPAPVASAGAGIHIPADKLTRKTAHLHYDTDDAALKAILLHNANEEIEHAAMLLEWLRRTEPRFHKELKEYLFTDAPITAVEEKAMGRE